MNECDVFIIGAGPAGMTAALYAMRYGESVVLADQGAPGGQLLLIDEIENYPGLGKVKGFELAENMEKELEKLGLSATFMEVSSIKKDGSKFKISTSEGGYEAKAVIIATGAGHRELGLENEKHLVGRGISYCATCDGPFFKGKDVVVVGGGDTALTDALYLSKIANKVHLVHRRNEFRGQKVLADKVRSNEKITLHLSHQVVKANDEGGKLSSVELENGEVIKADGLFIFVGITPNSSFLGSLVETENGFVVTNGKMETSLEGVYAIGDVRNTPLRQVSTAVGDGAIAAFEVDEYLKKKS